MTDLILAVMKNVNMWDVDCFVVSLSRTGFAGRKVFFVENIAEDARGLLLSLGYELIPFTTPAAALSVHFQTSRYAPAAEYLRVHHSEFRRVMWCDVWDVVFQSDPFLWAEEKSCGAKILLAKEGWLIKDQAINNVWIQKLVGPEEYRRLREHEVYCAGTILGESGNMTVLLQEISRWIGTADSMQGLDQGMLNVLARRNGFSSLFHAPEPSEGFICTAGPFLAPSDPSKWTIEPPVFDRETGLVWTTGKGKPFAVQHQYNRNYGPLNQDGAWRSIVQGRYR